MRRVLLVLICAAALIGALALPALAANPHAPGVTGQPNQSCEDQPSGPPGFDMPGFANAESHYAAAQNGNEHAVSQYDVACFQLSQ
jgi:hypothetical protein